MRRALLACGLIAVLVLALAGCSSDDDAGDAGGGSDAPSGVTSFVPAGSPAYVEISTDFEGEQWTQVDELGQLFPDYPELRERLDEELNQGDVNFDEDIRPLLGDRAAIALTTLPPGIGGDELASGDPFEGEAQLVAVVELAENQEEAAALLLRLGAEDLGEQSGVQLYGDEDFAAAVVDGHLVGAQTPEEVVAAVQAHEQGGAAVLSGEERLTDALGQLPEETLLEAYLDLGSIVDGIASSSPDLEQLGLFGDYRESVVALSVAAEPEGIRVEGLIANAPEGAMGEGFTPELLARAPADSYAYIGLSNLSGLIGDTLGSLEGEAGEEVQQQLEFLSTQLESQLGVTVDDLAALGSGEHAILAVPGGGEVPGVAVALDVEDGDRARATLDSLREAAPALIGMIDSSAEVREFRRIELDNGVEGWELPLTDDFGVVYGVDENLAILGSNDEIVRQIQSPDEALPDSELFQAGTEGLPEEITGILWINIEESVDAILDAVPADEIPDEVVANVEPLKSLAAWGEAGDTPSFTVFLRIAE